MKHSRLLLVAFAFICAGTCAIAQSTKNGQQGTNANKENWVKIVDDEISTIYYDSNIKTDSNGRHILWVKTIIHSEEWQRYMSQQIGSNSLVYSTKTKIMYDELYNYVLVRQVISYNKAGKN